LILRQTCINKSFDYYPSILRHSLWEFQFFRLFERPYHLTNLRKSRKSALDLSYLIIIGIYKNNASLNQRGGIALLLQAEIGYFLSFFFQTMKSIYLLLVFLLVSAALGLQLTVFWKEMKSKNDLK
jgi:hypothetical protein